MTVAGAERLSAAGELLQRIDADFSDRRLVLSAVSEIWTVISEGLELWPWALLSKAAAVQLRLVSYGPPAVTVRRMSRVELEELRADLLCFVDSATRCRLGAVA